MADTSRFELERITAPSQREFEERFLKPGRPVLISGIVDKWPAASSWNPEQLVSRVGKNQVPVSVMPRAGDYAGAVRKKMELAEYVASLTQQRQAPQEMYLGEVPLAKFFPELLGDVQRPSLFPDEEPLNAVMYMGSRQFSQLHYHPQGSATLCQVFGHKRLWLYPPDQTRYLYKYPWYSDNSNMSLTTSPTPDPATFPKFSQAKAIELVIGPGELLFIPIYWWHAIQNEELNIAVVFFWYRSARSRWLPPAGMRAQYFREIDGKLRGKARRAVRSLSGRA
jgi:hypothetical protein